MNLYKFAAAIPIALLLTACGSKDEAPAETTEQTTAVQTTVAAESADTSESKNSVGNTISNYTNNATAAIEGDDIYFVSKENNTRGIYRMSTTAGSPELLTDIPGSDLSAVGGTVYYLNSGNICTVSSNGTTATLTEDGTITDMCVTSDWIYFIKPDENGLGKVYKVMLTGSGETSVTPRGNVTDDIKTLAYAGGRLYFSDNSGVGYMSLDGKTKKYVITGYQVSDYSVYGDYLYFVYNGSIFRIKEGGASEGVACNVSNVTKINIAGDVTYLISDSGIGTMNSNGGSVSTIYAENPTEISVCGGYIFGSKGLYGYRVKTDGTDAVTFE